MTSRTRDRPTTTRRYWGNAPASFALMSSCSAVDPVTAIVVRLSSIKDFCSAGSRSFLIRFIVALSLGAVPGITWMIPAVPLSRAATGSASLTLASLPIFSATFFSPTNFAYDLTVCSICACAAVSSIAARCFVIAICCCSAC